MSQHFFMEIGPYFCYCSADEIYTQRGKWQASVAFERKSDHTAMRPLIPAIRHMLVGTFASKELAMAAAGEYAHTKGQEDVGIAA